MKIVSLTAENIKRLVAVEIKPNGNLVQITGKNGQGKTSVLDAIWWALGGAANIQKSPIRKGETQARVRLDLGEVVVTRKFREKDEKVTSSITVESADGARFPSPQTVIDQMLGSLTFDPLEFARTDPKGQAEILKGFVPGVDFDEIERLNREDYERRRDLNREVKRLEAEASSIPIAAGAAEPVDESAILKQLEDASGKNVAIANEAARRSNLAEEIKHLEANEKAFAEKVEELKEQIEEIQSRIETSKKRRDNIAAELTKADPIPERVDVSALRKKLEDARAANEAASMRKRKDELEAKAAEIMKQSDEITDRMKEREAKKAEAIAKADLPVQGLTLGDGGVLLNGLPFDQASDAEKLRTSAAIAMAGNPKLRVLRIRDGSLLDEDSLKLLADLAAERDYQVWVERVDGSGKVGFVIEDGALKAVPEGETAQSAGARS